MRAAYPEVRVSTANVGAAVGAEKMTAITFMAAIALAAAVSSGARADVGVYVKGGTLGVGGGVGVGLTDTLRLRAGYTALKISKDVSQTDIEYDGDLKLGGGEAMLDWHPFHGTFRVTAGLTLNRNEITADAEPTNGTYELNGNTYLASEIGSLDGKVDFKSTAPYLGIGWGDVIDKDGKFSFIADIGVLFQGSPDASLDLNCGPAVPAIECARIRDDVDEEERELQDDADDYKFWPVVSLGVAYRF
jgi:hypothetical protein